MNALLSKLFWEFMRNFEFFATALFTPIVACYFTYYAIVINVNEMTLGVVNKEANSFKECQRISSNNYNLSISESECNFQGVSCLFLEELAKVIRIVSLVFKCYLFFNFFEFDFVITCFYYFSSAHFKSTWFKKT
jgi:hypothetical protein